MMKGAACIKKGILLSFLLLVSVLTGCVQLSDAEQDAQENAYLAQRLFVADFDCNYDLLYQLTEDVLASGSDLSGAQGEICLLNDTSAKLFFSYHLCEIQNDFLPENLQEALDAYYEAFWQYIEALAQYTATHEYMSPEMTRALQQMVENLPQQTPYLIKYELFDLDDAETEQVVSWLYECTDDLLLVVQQAEAESA